MTLATRQVRPLDHLVLPVTSLLLARDRLSRLGFTVAPTARHPFGTQNACVFFSDKTYLEPLDVASQGECEEAALAGNQFVARDQAFRFRHGPEGFSAIVMGSNDAEKDHTGFGKNAISAGDMLQFSRPMRLPDGSEITATFKLAFAADLRSPDFHAITCQRINVPPADRSVLESHANGVIGIKDVILSEPNPEDFRFFVSEIVGSDDTLVDANGVAVKTGNTTLRLFNPDAMMAIFGIKSCHSRGARGLRGRAVIFQVKDLAATQRHLKDNEIDFAFKNHRLLVTHQEGQAILFGFEE